MQAIVLATAIASALSNNPTILKAREQLNESSAQIHHAISQALPTINAFAEIANKKDSLYQGNVLFGGEPYNLYNLSFQAVQPLYRGGALWSGLSSARKSRDIQELELRIAERDLRLRVMQSFYGMLLAERKLRSMLESEAVQKHFLGVVEKRYQIGREQRIDALQHRTQLALLRPKILQAQYELKLAASELATLIGQRDQTEIEIRGSLTASALDRLLAQYKDQKHERPELEKLSLLKDQFDDRRTVQLSTHWPQVSAVAAISNTATEKTRLFDENGRAWLVGVQVSIPLFSGLSSIFERKVLAAQNAQLEADEARAKDELSLEQVRAERDLELTQALTDATGQALDLARKAADFAQRTYQLQTTNYLQFFDTSRNLLEAELANNQANHDYTLAVARYFVAFDLPLEKLISEL